MSRDRGADGSEGIDPAGFDEVVSLVANETRFEVLRALWTPGDEGVETPLSFSTLRERAGIRDSGQFNYHLDQLTPRFVRKVEDGYELTYAGQRVIGAAVSGVYADPESVAVAPVEVGDCYECGAPVEASYEEGYATVTCTECDVTLTEAPAPPIIAASYDAEAFPAAFSRYLLTEVQAIDRGFCQNCRGRVEPSVEPSMEVGDRERVGVRYECQACGMELYSVVAGTVLDHPAVVAFLHDHGFDHRELNLWELDFLFRPEATVVGEDPLRVHVAIELDGDALELTVDGDLNVVDYERA